MSTYYLIGLIVVAIILVCLYVKYYKHNIYGGKFKEHFKDEEDSNRDKQFITTQ